MKQVVSFGKGSLNLCRVYWRWVNQIADSYKVPEEELNKMMQKGHFKTTEDAERATRRFIKGALDSAPIIFLLVLVVGISSKLALQSAIAQNNEALNSYESSRASESLAVAQSNEKQSPQKTSQDFKSFLPPENEKLRNFILSSSFLSSFLQNVWIGDGVSREQLTQRGFYLNTLYKHTGEGTEAAGEAKGACSPIGFRGAFICGRGMMAPQQWGIQSDEAIHRLNVLEEEWAELATEVPLTSSSPTQTIRQSSSTSWIVQANDGYANLRSQPSTEVTPIMKVRNGIFVTILGEQTNSSGQLWYKVQVNEQIGWIYSGLLN